MNNFETSISKVGTSFRGLFFGMFEKKLSLRPTLANWIASLQHMATMYQYLVVGVGKKGRILISLRRYLNRQHLLLELR